MEEMAEGHGGTGQVEERKQKTPRGRRGGRKHPLHVPVKYEQQQLTVERTAEEQPDASKAKKAHRGRRGAGKNKASREEMRAAA
jgi:hypothetical protein